MRRIAVAMRMDAPAETLWRRIATYDHWPEWGTSIRSVDADRTTVEPGDVGRVHTVLRLTLPFRITDVTPGRSWNWTVAGVPATGHEVIPRGPDSCVVRFTAPWPVAPYALIMRRSLRTLKRQVEYAADPNLT